MTYKRILFVLALITLINICNSHYTLAQVYIWEDDTGSHVTDNASEVPPHVLKQYGEPDTEIISKKENVKTTGVYDPSIITFRNMLWNSNIKEYNGMVLVEDNKYNRYYSRPTDQLSINDAALSNISYGFYQGRLSSVIIRFKGYTNYTKIVDAMNQKFSNGYQDNQYLKSFYWGLSAPATAHLEYSDITKAGTLIFAYKPIAEEMRNDSIDEAKKAAKDL